MTLQVDPDRLPLAVELGAEFVLSTDTTISPSYGGAESRYARRLPRVEATVTVGPEYTSEVIKLFRAQTGARYAFTARDWSDYTAVSEVLDIDTQGDYPLIKTYATTTRQQIRRILLPDTIEVYNDTVLLVLNTDYTILSEGIIHPLIPASFSGTITWTGTFFIPVRFDDTLQLTPINSTDRVAQQFRIVEVLG